MDFFAAGLIDHNVGKERGELGRGVPAQPFCEHLAGLGVEGGIQRQRCRDESTQSRAVPPVPGTVAEPDPCDPGPEWRSFHPRRTRRMGRRIQVQPNNVGGLLLEIRIVRGHVALDAMRLQSVLTHTLATIMWLTCRCGPGVPIRPMACTS